VDLAIYTDHLSRTADSLDLTGASATKARAVEVAEGRAAPHLPAHQASTAPVLGVARKPGIDLPVPRSDAGEGAASSRVSFEASSPLDVPAFLRRQS